MVDTTGKATVLYRFNGPKGDGGNPWAGLVRDEQGNLYGTTVYGASKKGTVFMLDATGNEIILHRFTGKNGDGYRPFGGLALGAQGSLLWNHHLWGLWLRHSVRLADACGSDHHHPHVCSESIHFWGGGDLYRSGPASVRRRMERPSSLWKANIRKGKRYWERER